MPLSLPRIEFANMMALQRLQHANTRKHRRAAARRDQDRRFH
jgi:hypothetical protein